MNINPFPKNYYYQASHTITKKALSKHAPLTLSLLILQNQKTHSNTKNIIKYKNLENEKSLRNELFKQAQQYI